MTEQTTTEPTFPDDPNKEQAYREHLAHEMATALEGRDKYLAEVTEALDRLQPSAHGLSSFRHSVEAAYAAEAYAHFARQSQDNALMVMHNWLTGTPSYSADPVARMVADLKAAMARRVVEDLARAGFVDDKGLRLFVLGIWGID